MMIRLKRQRKNVTSKGCSSSAARRITTFMMVEQSAASTIHQAARAAGGEWGEVKEGRDVANENTTHAQSRRSEMRPYSSLETRSWGPLLRTRIGSLSSS